MTIANETLTERLRRADTAHHLHPFTDYKALAAEGGSRIIARADGVHIWDSDGARILDGMAGLWCVNVGYGREELAKAAYRQMMELPYYNTFFKTATQPSVELAERLVELYGRGMARVFYGSSGSDANDTIVRMVRHFWNLKGEPKRKTIISRTYGYHGSTMASASLGGMKPMHGQADLPLPGFVHIDPPYWYGLGGDMTPDDFGRYAAGLLEARIQELGADSVAAFIAEPIQGAGGLIVPPETYWPEIQRICKAHGILLICDEVICGFGRTGHWFGAERYDIHPDIVTLAKGLTSGYQPLSAVLVGDRVADTLIEEGGEFYHGFTYSGHPVACAVALANLDIMERERLVEFVHETTGPYLKRRLHEVFDDHPLVGEVRAEGLLGAVELVQDKRTRTHFPDIGKVGTLCRDHCFKRNVILRAVRDTMVMSPPLIITPEQIDDLLDGLKRAVDATAGDLGRL